MRIKRIVGWAMSGVLIGSVLLAVYNRQAIIDWARLRNYTPPARVAELADKTTMNDRARRLFYVNRPELNDKETFNQNCTDSEATVVLGCYVSGQGIYVYDVKDKRLAGVHEVTAAHEMLHVAYERLSNEERAKIDALTVSTMKTIKDQRIIKTVKQYNDKDPNIVPNELHSILATEVRKLPAELEIYYQKYFNDRDKVVNLSESYEEAFNEIEDKVAAYDAELKVLKRQIEALQRTLELEQKQLASSKLSLDTYYEQKKYDQYNNLVPDYNALVREHNANVVVIQQKIDRYNTVVKLRNNLATQQNQLYKAIDSRPEKVKTR
jgi:hypothetical protein